MPETLREGRMWKLKPTLNTSSTSVWRKKQIEDVSLMNWDLPLSIAPWSSTFTNAGGQSHTCQNLWSPKQHQNNCYKQSQKRSEANHDQKAWRKRHDVSSTNSSTICRVNFLVFLVVAFVVVRWRFFIACVREHRLVLSSLFLPPVFPARLCLARDNSRWASNHNILRRCLRAGVLLLSWMKKISENKIMQHTNIIKEAEPQDIFQQNVFKIWSFCWTICLRQAHQDHSLG